MRTGSRSEPFDAWVRLNRVCVDAAIGSPIALPAGEFESRHALVVAARASVDLENLLPDANGVGRLVVRSGDSIGNYDQAGITIEKAGGATTPNMNQLVFVGAIK